MIQKYDELGFNLINVTDGVKTYRLSLKEKYPKVDCYHIVKFNGEEL